MQPDVAGLLEPEEAEVYRALTLALGDYVRKNGFTHVLIGLSGGIDSALTAAIAVDALGPESIWGVGMPSRHSSEGSVLDAKDLAARLGIRFDLVPMDQVFSAYLEVLEPLFAGSAPGVTEENLQARIRGAILMALSNKFGAMVVATGNKSEMAAGYSTLYGDMVGGYAVLKDVFKTLVYRLARWRNLQAEVIPPSSIEKPPSAELRPGQKDSDSLPPYDVLDLILAGYIEADLSVNQIVDQGIDREVVEWVDATGRSQRVQASPGGARGEDHHQSFWQGATNAHHQQVPRRVEIDGSPGFGRRFHSARATPSSQSLTAWCCGVTGASRPSAPIGEFPSRATPISPVSDGARRCSSSISPTGPRSLDGWTTCLRQPATGSFGSWPPGAAPPTNPRANLGWW